MRRISSIIIFIFINFIYSEYVPCIVDSNARDIYRNVYTYPESIESEHFKIHFTVSDVDSQFVNNQWMSLESNFGYAQSIIDLLEISMTKYIEDGWILPPPDCDENITDVSSSNHCINFGGDSLYDVYISNDGVGMVVPENPYQVAPYSGGYTSYMKISTMLNMHEIYPYWSHHVTAHELHHSIQLGYGSSTSGEAGNYSHNLWFFEQSATYMENVVFPYSNHLLTMLSNCNVVTPLTYPEYGINYPAEIFPYRSALWHKFLVESYGDSTITRLIWENYGLDYASGENVSLFPIYNNALDEVSNGDIQLSDAFSEYALWRYFTGDRSQNLNYFNQSESYCESKISTLEDSSYVLFNNTGGVYYFELLDDINNITIASSNYNDIAISLLLTDFNNNISTIPLFLDNETTTFNFADYTNYDRILIINTRYLDSLSEEIEFEIILNSEILLGDINDDGTVNINDIIILINYILLHIEYSDESFLASDINLDLELNIMDVVQLINIILSN